MKEIEKIVQAYQQVDWSKEQAALGIVVKVEGSAYRRIGARLFVQSNGQWVGGISGGCLEGDALKQAQKAMLKGQASIVVYDTTDDDPHQIGVGLGCNGRIEVLFLPIDGNNPNNHITFLKTIIGKRTSSILVQILNSEEASLKGSFYTEQNLNQLAEHIHVKRDVLEAKIQQTYHKRKSKVFTIQNEKEQRFEILTEIIQPKIKLICVGDNYDVNAMLDITNALAWEVHVVGKLRKLNKYIHRKAHQVHALDDFLNIPIDEHTAIVLMSHDYKTDLTILKQILPNEVPYLGFLGPRKRLQKMQEELTKNNYAISLQDLDYVHGPVGLDIGAESPEEISLSIVAEIIAFFRNRRGGSLKNRRSSIHEDNLGNDSA